MSSPNRTDTQAHDGQIITGITKKICRMQRPRSRWGASHSRRQRCAANQIAAAKAQWIDLTAKYATLKATAALVARGLKQYVMNAYGAESPVLADFGFTVPKRAALTVEQQTQAIAKRKATRKARNTLGKKQKAAIKGNVTGVNVTPITEPAAPAVAPGAVGHPRFAHAGIARRNAGTGHGEWSLT
jgi:hypothetical protein